MLMVTEVVNQDIQDTERKAFVFAKTVLLEKSVVGFRFIIMNGYLCLNAHISTLG